MSRAARHPLVPWSRFDLPTDADAFTLDNYLLAVRSMIVRSLSDTETALVTAAFHQGLPVERAAVLVLGERMEQLRKMARGGGTCATR